MFAGWRACLHSYPLRDELCCVLTSVEMTVVIRSATFGVGVSKSTPNSDLDVRAIGFFFKKPGVDSCAQ